MELKKGVTTSELWYSLIFSVLTLAAQYQLISTKDVEPLLNVVLAFIAAAPVLNYTVLRTWLKVKALLAANSQLLIDELQIGELEITER